MYQHPSLTDLSTFDAVTVTDGVSLIESPALRTLDGLHHDGAFYDSVMITGNETLRSVEALAGLTRVQGHLTLEDNPALDNLSGLDSLEFVGGNGVVQNNGLWVHSDASPGFDNLGSIAGTLEVPADFSISNFAALQSVGVLKLGHEPAWTDLSPFAQVTVTEGLLVSGNPLQSLNGLHHDGALERGVELVNTPALADLGALQGLGTIAGSLAITNAAALESLSGLEDLQALGEGLFIKDNPQLLNVDGLANLASIGVVFEITDNTRLENLDGLARLSTITDEPEGPYPISYIINNQGLPQCAADAVLAQLGDFTHGYAFGNDEKAPCN